MNKYLRALIRGIKDKKARFAYFCMFGFFRFMPDEKYLKKAFKCYAGYSPDLLNPKTFNEKLLWLKLYDRRPEYTTMVDKYAVKKWVAERIGKEYIIPTLGVWEHFDDIDFDIFPNQFVLKSTHDSGGLVIVKDKNNFNKSAAKKIIERRLKQNYYYIWREYPYKNVPPRIIAEPYMICKNGNPIAEYKIFCFNGKAKMILVCKGAAHSPGRTNDYCDLDFNRLPFTSLNRNSAGKLERPAQMDKMIELAETLAENTPQIRVDLYLCDDKIFFGELTLYHNSGICPIEPYEWDIQLGSWINLPEKK